MADDSDFIRYSDFIEPDDSINQFIAQLEKLRSAFSTVQGEVKNRAKDLQDEIASIPSSSSKYKQFIKEAETFAKDLNETTLQVKTSIAFLTREIRDLNNTVISTKGFSSGQEAELSRLKKAFSKLAPEIEKVTTGVSNYLQNDITGLNKSLKEFSTRIGTLQGDYRKWVQGIEEVRKVQMQAQKQMASWYEQLAKYKEMGFTESELLNIKHEISMVALAYEHLQSRIKELNRGFTEGYFSREYTDKAIADANAHFKIMEGAYQQQIDDIVTKAQKRIERETLQKAKTYATPEEIAKVKQYTEEYNRLGKAMNTTFTQALKEFKALGNYELSDVSKRAEELKASYRQQRKELKKLIDDIYEAAKARMAAAEAGAKAETGTKGPLVIEAGQQEVQQEQALTIATKNTTEAIKEKEQALLASSKVATEATKQEAQQQQALTAAVKEKTQAEQVNTGMTEEAHTAMMDSLRAELEALKAKKETTAATKEATTAKAAEAKATESLAKSEAEASTASRSEIAAITEITKAMDEADKQIKEAQASLSSFYAASSKGGASGTGGGSTGGGGTGGGGPHAGTGATGGAFTSYYSLMLLLADLEDRWKSLSKTRREDEAIGGRLAQQINQLKAILGELDKEIGLTAKQYKSLQDAKQKLAFLQSEEGQAYMRLQEEIRKTTREYKNEQREVDAIAEAKARLRIANEKLSAAETQDYSTSAAAELKSLKDQEKETQKLADLIIKMNSAKEGSYNQIAAQYEINKIKLNAMSAEERSATNVGKRLEQETFILYQRMVKLQEATGKYSLSVGEYKKMWSGLGFSVSQVVRELPALAINWNTFFLAISNNIPIVIDEIKKLRNQNKALIAEGQKPISITKTIIKSLLSFQTALVIVIAILSKYGDKIIETSKRLMRFKSAQLSITKALRNVSEAIKKENGDYGKLRVSISSLRNEWKELKTEAEKTQWIKDNKSAFDQLDISIKSINDAENAFIDNTEYLLAAMRYRAKAAAASSLAEKKYAEALALEEEKAQALLEGPNWEDKLRAGLSKGAAKGGAIGYGVLQAFFGDSQEIQDEVTRQQQERVAYLQEEQDAANTAAEAYMGIAENNEYLQRVAMRSGGMDVAHKKDKEPKGRQPRDLEDTIYRNMLTAEKAYRSSLTALIQDDFEQKRAAAADEVADENDKLREMLRMNEKYVANVEGKYKELTEDQRFMIQEQNAYLNAAIINNNKKLALQLEQIAKEEAANLLVIRREALQGLTDLEQRIVTAESLSNGSITSGFAVSIDNAAMEASLIEERDLMADYWQSEYELRLAENAKLLAANDTQARAEEDILIEMNKKILEIYAKYDKMILDRRKQDIDTQLELVRQGTQEELQLLLKQNEAARQASLSENAAKPAAQQQSTEDINAVFDKKALLIKGRFEMTGFEQAQAEAKATFEIIKKGATETTIFELSQEKKMWQKRLALAEKGLVEMSDPEIRTAEATIKKLDRLIKEAVSWSELLAEKGFGGMLLTKMGLDNDDYIDAMTAVVNQTISNIQSIIDYEVQLAEAAVASAEARVEAAQTAYEAEVEARNNGYANNVATAKKELQQARKEQREKEKLLKEAQRKQEAIDTVTQTSSLITATANLWSSLSGVPLIGHALALAAIATMWGSFAAAKIKARQVTQSSQEYGEGGLEFLEGGSHASGNDIDLMTTNSKGKNMRAEGGEAMAIINKRNTCKYKKVLPSLVDSLNKGVFEDKFINAFSIPNSSLIFQNNQSADLSRIEATLKAIENQGTVKQYVLPNGDIVIIEGNTRKVIKNR